MDKAKGWSIVDLPWWAWLLLAVPALVLMALLLTVGARSTTRAAAVKRLAPARPA